MCFKVLFALIMALLTGAIMFASMILSGESNMSDMAYNSSAFVFLSFGLLLMSRDVTNLYKNVKIILSEQ